MINNSSFKYLNITLGGTFDHFHDGHKAMIDKAFDLGETVWLGITTDEFARSLTSKFSHLSKTLEPYHTRNSEVSEYLMQNDWLERVELIPLEDQFGTTLKDKKIEAIVVSPETFPVAEEINTLRVEKEMDELVIYKVEWVNAKDNKPIHSIRIREGLISRDGFVYGVESDWEVQTLSDSLRTTLKKPLGKLITNGSIESAVDKFVKDKKHEDIFMLVVGDAVTSALLRQEVVPQVSVVDFKIKRELVFKSIDELGFKHLNEVKKIANPPGTLSYSSFAVLQGLIKGENKPAVLQIDGEDDLFTLFAILAAPLGAVVLYGQPGYHSVPGKAQYNTAPGEAGYKTVPSKMPHQSAMGNDSFLDNYGEQDEGLVVVKVTERKKQEIQEMVEEGFSL